MSSTTITLDRMQAEAARNYLVQFIYSSRAEALERAINRQDGDGSISYIATVREKLDEVEALISVFGWDEEITANVELPDDDSALVREAVRGAFEVAAVHLGELVNDLVTNEKPDAETLANKVDELSSLVEVLHAVENGKVAVA